MSGKGAGGLIVHCSMFEFSVGVASFFRMGLDKHMILRTD